MINRLRADEARLDEIGKDPGQVGPASAGQSGSPQSLSSTEDAANESVQELADSDQALEAAVVEGVEDAADHPERPVHTHLDYGSLEDLREPGSDPSSQVSMDQGMRARSFQAKTGADDYVDVEDLPDDKSPQNG
jgi:hypothetical protein